MSDQEGGRGKQGASEASIHRARLRLPWAGLEPGGGGLGGQGGAGGAGGGWVAGGGCVEMFPQGIEVIRPATGGVWILRGPGVASSSAKVPHGGCVFGPACKAPRRLPRSGACVRVYTQRVWRDWR